MNGSYDCYIRPEIAVISDRDLCVVLNGKVEISEKVLSYFCVLPVVESNRSLNKTALSKLSDYFGKDCSSLFRFVLMRAVVINIQIVRFLLDCF